MRLTVRVFGAELLDIDLARTPQPDDEDADEAPRFGFDNQ